MKKIIFLFSVLMLLSACSQKSESGKTVPDYVDSLVISYAGVEGKTVFELLDEQYEVGYQSSSMGVFVKAIDSVEIGYGYYWLFSINDSMASVAADKLMTADGDSVRWHFRKSE